MDAWRRVGLTIRDFLAAIAALCEGEPRRIAIASEADPTAVLLGECRRHLGVFSSGNSLSHYLNAQRLQSEQNIYGLATR
jgi:hypothetical protein